MIGELFKKLKDKYRNKPDNFIDKLKPEIEQFATVFDVGAYHGKFIDELLKVNPDLKVHAFEPFNESFLELQKKYGDKLNIKIIHAAVSDVSGRAVLNVNAFKETNSLFESSPVDYAIDSLTQQQSTETVEVINLWEYCNNNSIAMIDFVKIDTQGNSYNVLKGLEIPLREKKIRYLYVEAEFVEIYKNEKLFSEIELLMRGYGYYIVKLYNLNYINNQMLGWCDVLFTPKNQETL